MSLPHLLLVDDSEAILRFEQAALGGSYRFSTAQDGVAALELLSRSTPDLVVLDLSMPRMDGDEVLARMQADPALKSVPVIIVSTEQARGKRCVESGAVDYLPKPIRADQLVSAVDGALEAVRRRARQRSLAALVMTVGGQPLAIPLDAVRAVHELPATRPLPGGPWFLRSFFELRGEPVLLLDLARRLGLVHSVPVLERKVVVLVHEDVLLGLEVDSVASPEEIAESAVTPAASLGGSAHGPLAQLLEAIVEVRGAQVPVVRPAALLSPQLLRDLAEVLREQLTAAGRPPQ